MEPHVKLAVAIVKQAAEDLNVTIKQIRKCKKKIVSIVDDEQLENEKRKLNLLQGDYDSLIKFFKGYWFETLCDIIGMDATRVKELIVKSGKRAESEALNRVI